MRRLLSLTLGLTIAWCTWATPAAADELRLFPPEVLLQGPAARQRLIALDEQAGRVVGDRTRKARFTTANPKVATVDAHGVVQPHGDGETEVQASDGQHTATVKVRVQKMQEPFTWSYRNHVTPVLTRLGCNSG